MAFSIESIRLIKKLRLRFLKRVNEKVTRNFPQVTIIVSLHVHFSTSPGHQPAPLTSPPSPSLTTPSHLPTQPLKLRTSSARQLSITAIKSIKIITTPNFRQEQKSINIIYIATHVNSVPSPLPRGQVDNEHFHRCYDHTLLDLHICWN